MIISKFNYKVVLEFGTGKEERFKVNSLVGISELCRKKAHDRNSVMIHAKIIPISPRGKVILPQKNVYLDSLGMFHYYKQGQEFSFANL